MDRNEIIQNALHEGLNILKRPELCANKEKRLQQAIQNDIREYLGVEFNASIYINGAYVGIYDSVHNSRTKTFMTIEITFSLLRGPETIKLRNNTFYPAYQSMEDMQDMMELYNRKLQLFYQVVEFLQENYHTYQDNYSDVKKGRRK